MRFVSTFAGVGGFDLGLEGRGWTCVGQVEIDKYCRKVLDEHWPDVPKHDDIRTAIDWADQIGITGAVDVVVGGSPCQDLSVAGRRKGFDGDRSVLAFDLINFAEHVGAKHLVFENVAGLLTSNGGRDFERLMQEVADAGYSHIEWRVLDSQFFGVAQRRRRIFIVASSSARGGRPILVEPEGVRWHLGAKRAPWSASAGASEVGVGGEVVFAGSAVDPDRAAPLLATTGGQRTTDIDGATWIVKSKRARAADDDESWVEGGVVPTLNAFDSGDVRTTTVVGFNWQNGGGYGNANPGLGITPDGVGPLQVSQRPAVAGRWWNNADVAPTIDVSLASKGQMMPDKNRMFAAVTGEADALSVRRLTPIECERLQGFPDDWTACVSDTQRYKQMGNAVTVNVIDYIGWLFEVNDVG